MKPSRGPRGRLLVLTVTMAAVVVACTSDDEPSGARSSSRQPGPASSSPVAAPVSPQAPSSPSAPSSAAPTPAPGTPQGEALETYKQMMAAMVQASLTSDPDFPLLGKYATGEALVSLRYTLTVNRNAGLIAKGPMRMAPKVASVAPDSALVHITDCVDDTQWLRYRQDGSPFDTVPGGRRSSTAEVVLAEGAWKVSVLRVSATGTC